jgi:hypothetical protein
MAHDVFIFIDGVHRVWSDHIPHLDFITALGFINYMGPAWFGIFTGNEAQAFLYFNLAFLGLVLLLGSYIAYTRLNVLTAVLLIIYLSAIVGAPVNIGEPSSLVTYAMFYNRFGWALLILAFLLLLPPLSNRKHIFIADTLLIALLLFIATYLKITYFVAIAGLYSLVFALYSELRKKILFCAVVFAAGAALVEISMPGINLAYFQDMQLLAKANGGINLHLFNEARKNWLLLLTPLILLYYLTDIYSYRQDYSRHKHYVLVGFTYFISLFIIANNLQPSGIPTLFAIVAAASVILSRNAGTPVWNNPVLKVLMMASLIGFSLPEAIDRFSAIERTTRATATQNYNFPVPVFLKNHFYIEERPTSIAALQALENTADHGVNLDIYRDTLSTPRPNQEIYQSQYVYVIAKGVERLESVLTKYGRGPIVNFDFSNPFSTILGTPSAKGEYSWYHGGRNISASAHGPADQFLSDATYIAIPKFPVSMKTTKLLESVSAEYRERMFKLVDDSFYWSIYRRVDH